MIGIDRGGFDFVFAARIIKNKTLKHSATKPQPKDKDKVKTINLKHGGSGGQKI